MRSAAAYVSILLLGWTCLPGETSQAQTLFTDVTVSTLGNVTHTVSALPDLRIGTGAAWFDYDRDGDLDLYMTNRQEIEGTGAGSQDRLFHNNGDGTFTDVSYLLGGDDNLGGYGFVATWTDYDNDGDLDILLINDCPFGPVGTKLFRNDGGTDPLAWTFTEVSAPVGAADCRHGMGIAVGDDDPDGCQD